MAPPPDDEKPGPDPKVKELLERDLGRPLKEVVDEVTAAELEKWFGLPSFTELEEGGGKAAAPAEDPDVTAVRERRAKAIEAVLPQFIDAIHDRFDRQETLLTFKPDLEVHVDPTIARFDLDMIDRRMAMAEPREVQRPEDIEDQLKDDVTPQALLRDLHRPELEFEKLFEVIDVAAEQKLDIVAEVARAMKTSWKLPPLSDRPSVELRRLLSEARAERDAPWPEIPNRANLPNRRVTE